MDRRRFLKASSTAALAFSATPIGLRKYSSQTYKTALIGSGWWGMNILRTGLAFGQCQVVGLCDVDRTHLETASQEVHQLTGDTPRNYADYRELLTIEKPDIVIVATPDHWHPLITIAAIEQGAHVYVEKPIGHTIKEGRAMVEAARKHGKVVQVGTHRRVSPHNVSGMEFLKSGKAGHIGMVRAFVHYGGGPGQITPNSAPLKASTGICGADLLLSYRIMNEFIPVGFGISWILRMGKLGIGGSTGSTKYYGGRKKNIRNMSILQEDVSFAKTIRTLQIHKLPRLSSSLLQLHGSIGNMHTITQKKLI